MHFMHMSMMSVNLKENFSIYIHFMEQNFLTHKKGPAQIDPKKGQRPRPNIYGLVRFKEISLWKILCLNKLCLKLRKMFPRCQIPEVSLHISMTFFSFVYRIWLFFLSLFLLFWLIDPKNKIIFPIFIYNPLGFISSWNRSCLLGSDFAIWYMDFLVNYIWYGVTTYKGLWDIDILGR